jgi:hypothetical protein
MLQLLSALPSWAMTSMNDEFVCNLRHCLHRMSPSMQLAKGPWRQQRHIDNVTAAGTTMSQL